MDGGQNPIRDGDWPVMRYARGAGLAEIAGRVALIIGASLAELANVTIGQCGVAATLQQARHRWIWHEVRGAARRNDLKLQLA